MMPAGNQLKLTDPSANKTTKSYNAANELVGKGYSDGKTHNVTMAYDADRQRTSISDGTGTSKWTYDSLHRITSTVTGAAAKIAYTYDLADQLTQLTYPGSTIVSRAYDAGGRMTSVTDWLGDATIFAYDVDGNLVQETLPGSTGIIAKYTYDAASPVSSIAFTKGTTNVASFSYKRDAMGQLIGVTDIGIPTAGSDTVGYTKLNQLASVNLSTYTYSAANDITGLITPSQVTLNYDVSNELTTLTAGTVITKFNYDTRGNRLKRTPPTGPALAYTYDQANRMSAFGSNATYSPDGDGLRMSKKIGGVSEAFTWDRSGPLPLMLKDGTTTYVYDGNGLPLEQVNSSGTVLFYLHDQLGSTRLLSSTAGAVKGSYTYDAYGNLLGKTGTVANPFAYAGQYSDAESGLICLRARYYDPATARFLSRDPLVYIYPLRFPYGYSQDNPLNESDPTGLHPRRR